MPPPQPTLATQRKWILSPAAFGRLVHVLLEHESLGLRRDSVDKVLVCQHEEPELMSMEPR